MLKRFKWLHKRIPMPYYNGSDMYSHASRRLAHSRNTASLRITSWDPCVNWNAVCSIASFR
jgi:hypothetical protein